MTDMKNTENKKHKIKIKSKGLLEPAHHASDGHLIIKLLA